MKTTSHFCYNSPLSLSNTPTLISYSNNKTHIQRTDWPTIPFINASVCNVTLHTYTTDCHLFSAMFRALHLHITQHLLAPAATLSKNIYASIIYMKPPTFALPILSLAADGTCRYTPHNTVYTATMEIGRPTEDSQSYGEPKSKKRCTKRKTKLLE